MQSSTYPWNSSKMRYLHMQSSTCPPSLRPRGRRRTVGFFSNASVDQIPLLHTLLLLQSSSLGGEVGAAVVQLLLWTVLHELSLSWDGGEGVRTPDRGRWDCFTEFGRCTWRTDRSSNIKIRRQKGSFWDPMKTRLVSVPLLFPNKQF